MSACAPDAAARIRELRAEARRDLGLLLRATVIVAALVVAAVLAGGVALWPLWGAVGASTLFMVAVALWGAFVRGWRVLQAGRPGAEG